MTNRHWQLAHGRSLELGPSSLVMGILNVTPDSFADGGRHDDPATGVAPWWKPFRVSYDWDYEPVSSPGK